MTEMFRKPTTEVNESIKSKLFLDQKSGSKTSARLSPQSQLFFWRLHDCQSEKSRNWRSDFKNW